jgi:hypothetical protein
MSKQEILRCEKRREEKRKEQNIREDNKREKKIREEERIENQEADEKPRVRLDSTASGVQPYPGTAGLHRWWCPAVPGGVQPYPLILRSILKKTPPSRVQPYPDRRV